MDNNRFQIKMYCKILGINYEDIENLSLEEQLEKIEESGKEGLKIVEQTKQTLSELLVREREENKKFEEDIAQSIRIVNEGYKRNKEKSETR